MNHYGVHIEENVPVTGVYNGNDVTSDAFDDQIDPNAETYCPRCGNDVNMFSVGEDLPNFADAANDNEICPHCGNEIDWSLVENETTEWLLGSWYENDEGKWDVDEENGDFAALYDSSDNILQVVWSKYIRYGRLASPCYPGQVDARTDDPLRARGVCVQAYYAMPDDLLYC